jgi:hypothetical protein
VQAVDAGEPRQPAAPRRAGAQRRTEVMPTPMAAAAAG